MIAPGARIAVVGAGLMGHGIAQVFAAAGHPVAVHDPAPESLSTLRDRIRANLRDLGQEEAAAERVEPVPALADAVRGAAFVVEAALEDLAVKRALFAEIESAAPPDAILASNTSVIPITRIMEGLRDRSRALGTHWWNPPYLVPLVEVVGTEWTSAAAVEATIALHVAIGKTPVRVKRDVAGFIGNRLQHALWREAIALVEGGVCDAETVDTVVKASFGRRLACSRAWCAAEGRPAAIPAAPETVGAYPAALAPRYRLATLRWRLAALARAHRGAGRLRAHPAEA